VLAGSGSAAFSNVGTLVGGQGSDLFSFGVAGTLSGRLYGLGGSDTVDYYAFTTGVTVNLPAGTATGVAGTISGIENLHGGAGDDVLIGDNGNNVLIGYGGNDILVGNGGVDLFIGGAGRDIEIGGDGVDVLIGGPEEDLLIGGRTTIDANVTALKQWLAQWADTGLAYAGRVAAMRPSVLASAIDDGSVDFLAGGAALDWYVAGQNDSLIGFDGAHGEVRTQVAGSSQR